MLLEILKLNRRFRSHNAIEYLHVFFLETSIGPISLPPLNMSHVVGGSGEVGAGSHQVVRWCMEDLGQLCWLVLAWLQLVGPLTVNDALNLLK
jgi:hypothetical protein